MIAPNEVAARAKQKEDENYAFRTFLKNHADPKELDAQFLELTYELFPDYDCNSCRNCCKEYRGNLSDEDIAKCAEKFRMTPDDFKAQYLHQNREGSYDTNHKPCDFFRTTEAVSWEIANLSIALNFHSQQDRIAGQAFGES